MTISFIAETIGVSVSTVSREIKRNSNERGRLQGSSGSTVGDREMDTIVGKDGKGAIENINGLIRQYIPKKTDFRGISSGFIAHVTEKLNNRPREKNGFVKPKDFIKKYYT